LLLAAFNRSATPPINVSIFHARYRKQHWNYYLTIK